MDEKLLKIFRPEAKEYLQKLNENLLSLEKDPNDEEVMEEILRVAHSMKGTAAMVGFKNIAEISHKIEDILKEINDNEVSDITSISPTMFEGFDTIDKILKGEELDTEDIVSRLKKAAEDIVSEEGKEEKDKPSKEVKKKTQKKEKRKTSPEKEEKTKESATSKTKVPSLDIDDTVRVSVDKVNELMNLCGEMLLNWQKFQNYSVDLRQAIRSITASKIPQITRRQERLMNLEKNYKENTKSLDVTVNMLQDLVMDIRMLPISTIFTLLPRVVHDVAIEYDKKVEVEIRGESTELDKRMIEHLKDPLIHIIRNAIYHGIETPKERLEKGKPETGKIILSAYQQGDRVYIQVEDDGRGVDAEKIRKAAVDKGYLPEEDAYKLSREDVLQMIFNTGFSSRDEADSISGRGVGLDVVKKSIEENLVGQVMVETEIGKGTAFTIILPLTLLINTGLLVEAAGQIFVFLINAVETVAYIDPFEIHSIEGENAVKIRDYTVPILALEDVLGVKANGGEVFQQSEVPVVVVKYCNQRIAFAVSRLIRQKDIVIKTLQKPIGKLKNIAGVTILENGLPAVILHVPDLIGTIKHKQFTASSMKSEREVSGEKKTGKKRIIVAEDSATTRDLEKSILESLGYEVDAFEDGAKAYENLQNSPPETYDLVFTDVKMPNMNGLEYCEKIRSNDQYSHLPVIIVSSMGSEEDKRKGLEAGADAYIVKKDFNQPKVSEIIERLIGGNE